MSDGDDFYTGRSDPVDEGIGEVIDQQPTRIKLNLRAGQRVSPQLRDRPSKLGAELGLSLAALEPVPLSRGPGFSSGSRRQADEHAG